MRCDHSWASVIIGSQEETWRHLWSNLLLRARTALEVRLGCSGLYLVSSCKTSKDRLHSLSGQPVLGWPCSEKGFSSIQLARPLSQFLSCPPLHHCEQTVSIFMTTYSQALESCYYVPSKPATGWTSPVPSTSPQGQVLSSLTIFVAVHSTHSSLWAPLFHWGASNSIHYSRCALRSAKLEVVSVIFCSILEVRLFQLLNCPISSLMFQLDFDSVGYLF